MVRAHRRRRTQRWNDTLPHDVKLARYDTLLRRPPDPSVWHALSRRPSALTRDARVGGEPSCDATSTPVREKVDNVAPLEVDEHAAIGPPAPESKIVDAQDARRWLGRKGLGAHPGKQGVATDRDPELAQQPRAGLAAEREGDVSQPVLSAVRASRMWLCDTRQPLSEDAAATGGSITEEAPRPQEETGGKFLPREICQPTAIPRMHPS